MALLIRASGKADGEALMPGQAWNQKRVPVRVVDGRWIRKHEGAAREGLKPREREYYGLLWQLAAELQRESPNKTKAAGIIGRLIGSSRFLELLDGNSQPEPGNHPTIGGVRMEVLHSRREHNTFAHGIGLLIDLARDPKDQRKFLAAAVSAELSRAIPCTWIDKANHVRIGMYCPYALPALCSFLLFERGMTVASCLRCGALIVSHNLHKRSYCSERCKNTHLTAKRRRKAATGHRE